MPELRYLATLVMLLGISSAVSGAAPRVLHTAGYEAPVRGGPDELLMIAGADFAATDRVVYQATDAGALSSAHPTRVPDRRSADAGTAEVVQIATPPDSLTVRLPGVIQPDRIYRLWVVNAAGEWSAAMPINDPRPMWVTPSYVHESVDVAGLGRRVRVIGRNLAGEAAGAMRVRLEGPHSYSLAAVATSGRSGPIASYVAEASLPARLAPGLYSVAVSSDGRTWFSVKGQRLEVRPDPPSLPRYALDDPRFGGCRPGDGIDDGPCLTQAIATAKLNGGGVIVVPGGTWDLSATGRFVLPRNVQLVGADDSSTLVSHDAAQTRPGEALLTVTGGNSIIGLTFTDTQIYHSFDSSRPIIRLGTQPADTKHGPLEPVDDIIITHNRFHRVGRAIGQSDRRIERLFLTHNEFAGYDRGIELPGSSFNTADPFRVDDSIVRWNRFVPGSYVDVAARQGVIASGIGAAYRLDFSSNTADGTSTEGLQDPGDPKGWRAAFFWNMNNNDELVLVAQNQISCSGDKAGDGEALSFDGSGNYFAFNGTPPVTAATADTLTLHGTLLGERSGKRLVGPDYYRGHWLQVVDGPGIGQVRKITSYTEDPDTGLTVFHVSPAWDISPSSRSRVVVGREYWHLYIVANEVDQRAPPCQKANLNGPSGGTISIWAPSADSVIEGNRQHDTNGILISMAYTVTAPSCPTCTIFANFQTALDIRGNLVDGEYAWDSDCSRSGISAVFGASPTPESPPPAEAVGISISHNEIRRADGFRGGAIDVVPTWFRGPLPNDWPVMRGLAIFDNTIRDINGPPPAATCKFGQGRRVAIRFEGAGNTRNAVLSGNRCERVDSAMDVGGNHPLRICSAHQDESCECRDR
jgi:hypothetical protein